MVNVRLATFATLIFVCQPRQLISAFNQIDVARRQIGPNRGEQVGEEGTRRGRSHRSPASALVEGGFLSYHHLGCWQQPIRLNGGRRQLPFRQNITAQYLAPSVTFQEYTAIEDTTANAPTSLPSVLILFAPGV